MIVCWGWRNTVDALLFIAVPWTPMKLSVQIENLSGTGRDEILFVIGGAFGLSEEVLERANERLSLPKKEYPYQLARIVVMERLYRAFRMSLGEPLW
ncbi:23S rRNA (pseudouridine(1915)-N(3))-methyltransferase RlmH [Brevibacillus porteri]|uniref:Uncharacterized protein n=1 Tax=Brevibacillus porteri TaxID=2126350 RepID=A0ABX5FRK8_9BACL|nr:23S rRNA (pseudouridine(1915)-N(3))-methyltransferase RlmH [Brevibacillus porteri]MED1798113.1 23S rRNA (pseudouridine(1915)-N(3))-methyltransferase RlmH [Brevibacillus porteri]MED2132052.1 23S rRNA (pseudouridine(1915)-N(3))-methyltransferase RlmH [Brevibacillus porteri]MED2742615.1 23S rRNA (pseudouridine(1915)-N(3))-methyltransferase RlmH [Brevibacillus porteri]MED2814091.1 23S rRNA (pseudouridine(1915)-N(3))-methyltransferase RlmH [Brevibacillus porteri]MED2893652.1 23S rRNA (pseudourid